MLTRGRIEVLAESPAGGHTIGAPATHEEVRELARIVLRWPDLTREYSERIRLLRVAVLESLADTDLCEQLLRDALREDNALEHQRLANESARGGLHG